MKKNLSKEQLFEHFSGKSSLLQKRTIEAWLQDSTNEESYYTWLEEWEREHLFWRPDTEAAYEEFRIRNEKSEEDGGIITLIKPWWQHKWVIRVAASIALLVVSYAFKNELLYQNFTTQYGELQGLTLGDGTKVMLNSNSTLRIPRFGFGSATREVLLEGEAYFTVKHTLNNQKFVVKTAENYAIEVLGTEFSVKNRNHDMQVILDKGKVKVHYNDTTQAITMQPGDLVTLKQNGMAQLEKPVQPKKYTAWRSHKFIFDKTKLSEVATLLQDNFGLDVTITSPALARKSISGEIEAKTADELLNAITEIFNIKIIKENKHITFQDQ